MKTQYWMIDDSFRDAQTSRFVGYEALRAQVSAPDERICRAEQEATYAAVATAAQQKRIAVMPIHGFIDYRPGWMADTSVEVFGRWFDKLANDPGIGAIVLDVDSPGGSVAGVEEMSAQIFAARSTKRPIIAVSNTMMASAAYYIGSAADVIVASSSSVTGSIGVVAVHLDWSKALEAAGVKATVVKAGKNKAEGNPYEPLNDEARMEWQRIIDGYYAQFVGAVARNRGITAGRVERDFGQGRTMMAAQALEAGMVDRIDTLDNTLARLAAGKPVQRRNRAAAMLAMAKLG